MKTIRLLVISLVAVLLVGTAYGNAKLEKVKEMHKFNDHITEFIPVYMDNIYFSDLEGDNVRIELMSAKPIQSPDYAVENLSKVRNKKFLGLADLRSSWIKVTYKDTSYKLTMDEVLAAKNKYDNKMYLKDRRGYSDIYLEIYSSGAGFSGTEMLKVLEPKGWRFLSKPKYGPAFVIELKTTVNKVDQRYRDELPYSSEREI